MYKYCITRHFTQTYLSTNRGRKTKKYCTTSTFRKLCLFVYYSALAFCAVAAGAKETVTGWDDLIYMQDMTSDLCNKVAVNANKALIDKRDGNIYSVTKLKDNNCWMTQNLRLITSTPLSSLDSDITSGSFTLPVSDINGFTSSDQDKPKLYYAGNATNGAYYNWYTAVAGKTVNTGTATDSICPKGWRLPTSGNNTGEFYTLLNGLGPSTIVTAPYNFVYSGRANDSALNNATSDGWCWSSTASGNTYAFNLTFTSSNITPSNVSPRYSGYSIRCVAR